MKIPHSTTWLQLKGQAWGAVAELHRGTVGRLAGWAAVGIPVPQKPLLRFAQTL